MKQYTSLLLAAGLLVVGTGCLAPGYRRPYPAETAHASEPFLPPLRYMTILSRYGPRSGRFHTGIDLRGWRGGGDPVFASRSGRVTFCSRLSGYGNIVAIQHSDGFTTRYAHLKKISVKKGQKVKSLQEIGIVGRTGRASTEHLHFEILTPKSRFLDPYPYLFSKMQ